MGPALVVGLPELEAVYGSSISWGTFHCSSLSPLLQTPGLANLISLSLPRLRLLKTDIHIDTTKELAVNLPFKHVRAVQLRGKIKTQV